MTEKERQEIIAFIKTSRLIMIIFLLVLIVYISVRVFLKI
jgi:hypothetical protein